MIIVTGTKRSGTSLWMHLLSEAGLPCIGERYPAGWASLVRHANPDGVFESELAAGVYFRTNPHPLTGAYLTPEATRGHAVKIFIPGLVRTDIAYIDRCVATIRPWRAYVRSSRRVVALGEQARTAARTPLVADDALPAALRWWSENFALIRNLAIRGFPAHVVSYDALLRDPERVTTEVLRWIGAGSPAKAAAVVRPTPSAVTGQDAPESDQTLADGIDAQWLAVFDALYEKIDGDQPLSERFIRSLNQTDEALRPLLVRAQATVEAGAVRALAFAGDRVRGRDDATDRGGDGAMA